MFDLIIKNGNIIDGTGSKPRKSDIGINGDKIISIGDLENQEAKTIVDAEGLCVSPGFIDTHSHADFDILRDPQHIYGISQGVTTEILSPDGIDKKLASPVISLEFAIPFILMGISLFESTIDPTIIPLLAA